MNPEPLVLLEFRVRGRWLRPRSVMDEGRVLEKGFRL